MYGKGLGGGTRDVPCSNEAFERIDLARQELLRRRRVRIRSKEPLFWTIGRKEPKPMDYQSLRSWWRALTARHGFNYTLHHMRHTAAFRMVESGHMTLTQVQEALGHRNLTTTQLYTQRPFGGARGGRGDECAQWPGTGARVRQAATR